MKKMLWLLLGLLLATLVACGNAAEDITKTSGLPIPEGVLDLQADVGVVSYSTTTPFAELVQFYRQSLPAAGWEITNEINLDRSQVFYLTKAGEKAELYLSNSPTSPDRVDVGFLYGEMAK